jgi:hypothetical protein
MTTIFTVKVERGSRRNDAQELHIDALAVQAVGAACRDHPCGAATIIYLAGGDSIEALDPPERVLAAWLECLGRPASVARQE